MPAVFQGAAVQDAIETLRKELIPGTTFTMTSSGDGSTSFKVVQDEPAQPILRVYDPMGALKQWHQAIAQTPFLELDFDARQKLLKLRKTLIDEEYSEVMDEIDLLLRGRGSLAALMKELADLLVNIYGTAEVLGVHLPDVFHLVMENNMTKVDIETGEVVRRADGKIEKPSWYKRLTLDDINNVIVAK